MSPDQVRRGYVAFVKGLLDRQRGDEGWSHSAVVEPGARYEVTSIRGGHGATTGATAPAFEVWAVRESPDAVLVGFLIKVGGFALGGVSLLVLALLRPGPAPALQLALMGAFFGAMIGWLVSLGVVAMLSARNPTTEAELEALRAELRGLIADPPADPEPDLLADVSRRFAFALARHGAAPTQASLQALWDLSALARCIAPLYGEARLIEVAELERRRDEARDRTA